MGEGSGNTRRSSRHSYSPFRQVHFQKKEGDNDDEARRARTTTSASYTGHAEYLGRPIPFPLTKSRKSNGTNATGKDSVGQCSASKDSSSGDSKAGYSTSTAGQDISSDEATKNTQPDGFPALRLPQDKQQQQQPPQTSGQERGPGGFRHTSTNPSLSVGNQGFGQPPFGGIPAIWHAPDGQLPAGPTWGVFHPAAAFVNPPSYYLYSTPSNTTMDADFQNAGPQGQGLNFQPPVPDTSMGPMNHVYTPRSDVGPAPPQHSCGPFGFVVCLSGSFIYA